MAEKRNIGTLAATGTLDPAGLQSGLQAMRKSLEATGQQIQSLGSKFSSSLGSISRLDVSGFMGGLGLGAGATGIVSTIQGAIKETLDLAKAQEKIQRQFGVSGGAAVGIMNLASRVGIDTGELTSALTVLERHFGEARLAFARGESGGGVAHALQLLGVEARGFLDIPLNQQLGILGDRIREVPNPADRAALAFQILGRHGMALLPMLMRGSQELERISNLAVTTGAAFGNETAVGVRSAHREFSDFTADLGLWWQGAKNRGIEAFINARRFMVPGNAERFANESLLSMRGTGILGSVAGLGLEAAQQFGLLPRRQSLADVESQLQLRTAIEDATRAMRDQAQAVGLTAAATQRLALMRRGATDEQLREFDAQRAWLDVQQRMQQQADAEQQLRLRTREGARSPLDRFREEMGQLEALRSNNRITAREFGFGASGLLDRLGAGLPEPGRLASALVAGSAAAVSEANRNRAAGREGVSERIQRILEMSEQQQQRQTEYLEEIANALRDRPEIRDLLTGGGV